MEKNEKRRRRNRNVRGQQRSEKSCGLLFFFSLLFTFRKQLKLFGVYQNGNLHREKAKITPVKNWISVTPPSPLKISLLRPCALQSSYFGCLRGHILVTYPKYFNLLLPIPCLLGFFYLKLTISRCLRK